MKRKFQVLSVLLALLLTLTACSAPAARLTAEEIEALRVDYPFCCNPGMVEIMFVPIEENIERAHTFVYGEIVGEVEEFESNLSFYNSDRFRYTATVIDDSEGLFKKGEQVPFSESSLVSSIISEFSNGMQFIAAYKVGEEDKNNGHCLWWSMFYVTEDGYVIATFDEALMGSELILNGMRVEDVLKAVKKEK